MDKAVNFFGTITLLMVMVFAAAVMGGTILWLIYPHLQAMFPNAVSAGVLAKDVGWWDAVCIVWIFGLLVKGHPATKEK